MNPELVGRFATARVILIGVLPTATAALFIMFLVAAGAPGPLDLAKAWQSTTYTRVVQAIPAILGVALLAIVLLPLQPVFVRLLSIRLTSSRSWKALFLAVRGKPVSLGDFEPSRLGMSAYPNLPDAWYGLYRKLAWPRLYPLLSERVRAMVDDRRNEADFAVRLCVTSFLTTIVSGILLRSSDKGALLALIPAVLTYLGYFAASLATASYIEACRVAFDLHRFDLLTALHIKLPTTPGDELDIYKNLNEFWGSRCDRRGLPASYEHPSRENP